MIFVIIAGLFLKGFLVAYVLIAVGAVVSASRDKSLSPWLIFSAVISTLFMGLAVTGSISPWPAAPDSYLPDVFAVSMALGIAWMFIGLARPKITLSFGN